MADSVDGGTLLGESVTDRRANIALVGILVVFVLICLVIALKTPAGESNDEPSHVQNIETLDAGHWYGMHLGPPRIVRTYGENFNVGVSSGLEAHQAPLYYLALAGWQRLSRMPAATPQSTNFSHPSPPDRLLLWLRIPNIGMGALTIWFTFLAARIVTRDPWSPVVAASIIGFMPRFVFLSAFVTNDNLVNLIGALLTFAALRYAISPSGRRMALVGVLVGLLIITKLSALPVAAVVLLLAFLRREWLKRLELTVIGVFSAVVVCTWYLIQNTVRYGSPLAGGASERYLTKIQGTGMQYDVTYRVTDPARLIFVDVPGKFLHAYWYGDVLVDPVFHKSVPLPVSLLFWLLPAFALVSLIGRHVSPKVLGVLGALAVTGFLSVWIVAFQTGTYDPRLALVGMPALAILAALGLERWKPGVRLLLPVLGLGGTLVAVQQNVLAVH